MLYVVFLLINLCDISHIYSVLVLEDRFNNLGVSPYEILCGV